MLDLFLVGLLSFGIFAGDYEAKNFDGLAGVLKKKHVYVRKNQAVQACRECRRLKTRCEKLPEDEKCGKCDKNRKKCIFDKSSKRNRMPKIMSVAINQIEAAHAQPQETQNSSSKLYPEGWLDESELFPNLSRLFSSQDH